MNKACLDLWPYIVVSAFVIPNIGVAIQMKEEGQRFMYLESQAAHMESHNEYGDPWTPDHKDRYDEMVGELDLLREQGVRA